MEESYSPDLRAGPSTSDGDNLDPLRPFNPDVDDSSRLRGRTVERAGSTHRSMSRKSHQQEHADTDGDRCISPDRADIEDGNEACSTNSRQSSIPSFKGFEGHRDSLAIILLAQKRRRELPKSAFERILWYSSHADYLSLRLVCRQWSKVVSQSRPPRFASIYYSPTEILQQILGYLDPTDFNSARHTSKAWMAASLDKNLLNLMIKRGGWSKASQEDARREGLKDEQRPLLTDEWVLSKRLATECLLNADWKGHGIRDGSCSPRFNISTTVDFSDLGNGYSSSGGNAAVNFTVSGCSNFVLVAEGCVIYLYQFLGTSTVRATFSPPLRSITSIICPRRVLGVSMDTSAQRYAIAALLEGRMGLVCDVHIGGDTNRSTQAADDPVSALNRQSIASPSVRRSLTDHRATVQSTSSYGERIITEPAMSTLSDPIRPKAISTRGQVSDIHSPENGITIENGARSVYRNLCSFEDPPRSVAICPQRRCVAFGCSSGIELHWVDALTGQDLNRWFPLAAPSDFLYFLLPRKGIDSAKKLRLISSAAHPHERSSILNRFHPTVHTHPAFFAHTPAPFSSQPSLRAVECDHYQAVPLSDGCHMLFTDPTTGLLCVGRDAPLGGPTKLLRRIMMIPPPSIRQGLPPSTYAAGTDLRWGVRVVAAHGDKIVLYSIPSDIFEDATTDRILTNTQDGHDVSWHDYYYSSAPPGTDADTERGLWPVRIEGFEIGVMNGVVDFAVVAGPSLTIWAFNGRKGEAVVWDFEIEHGMQANQAMVCSDGTIIGLQDRDGDISLPDAPNHDPEQYVGFDGTDSGFPNRSTNVVHFPEVGIDAATSRVHGLHTFGVLPTSVTNPLFDMQIPSLEQGWNGEGNGADGWLMQYLGHATDDEALRIMGFETLDLEVLS